MCENWVKVGGELHRKRSQGARESIFFYFASSLATGKQTLLQRVALELSLPLRWVPDKTLPKVSHIHPWCCAMQTSIQIACVPPNDLCSTMRVWAVGTVNRGRKKDDMCAVPASFEWALSRRLSSPERAESDTRARGHRKNPRVHFHFVTPMTMERAHARNRPKISLHRTRAFA